MKIPFNKSVIPNRLEVSKRFEEILDSGILTNNGPMLKQFESALLEFSNSAFCIATSSGTSALELSIKALDLKGEIITTPFSFIATASSILWQHCSPVFVDIDKETLCIDPLLIEEKINEKTCAILPVHVYGNPCDIDAIEEIAKKHKLKTIYDGAHAFGVKYKNKCIFNYGDISITSLHAYKIVNAGEGGVVFTQNEALRTKLYEIRYFGKNNKNLEIRVGTNAKMNEFNAALGQVSLMQLDEEISQRREIAQQYLSCLNDKKTVEAPSFLSSPSHNLSYFPIILSTARVADEFIEQAKSGGVEVRRYFHPLLNQLPFISNEGHTPVALDISKRIVCVPIYSTLSELELKQILQLLNELT